jgi:hypothetical protein
MAPFPMAADFKYGTPFEFPLALEVRRLHCSLLLDRRQLD